MAWQTPKTDRTITHKGYFNFDVLNRIEGNCEYLAEQFNNYNYIVNITVKTDWNMTDLPYLSEIDRVRDNINELLDAFYVISGSPDIRYWSSLDWEDANSLEQNLLNLKTLLDLVVASFKYAGAFYSGQEVIL